MDPHPEAALADNYALLIDGAWHSAPATFAVRNPATGAVLASVPAADSAAIARAIDAAAAALPAWSATPAPERAACLRRLGSLLRAEQERLALVMTLEQGKPLAEARGEIAYAAGFCEWFAGEAERSYGQIIPASAPGKRLLTLRQPVGVAALITPWNFPTAMLARKLAPALAAGCTVVCKPAEQTPLSALELGRLTLEAGIPAGVVNIVTLDDPRPFAAAIMADARVRKLSFTGSTEVGVELLTQAAPTLKRVSLELGGNAPLLVFDDADLEVAVAGALASKFRNAGQTCVCANRIFVQRGIYAEFARRFTAAVQALTVGNGLAAGTSVGPLIDAAAQSKVARHVREAVAQGAEVLCGGAALPTAHPAAHFWQPTVLGNASAAMLVAREETFGPVAPLIPFDSEAEALAQANATDYGLAAYVFTRDIGRVWRVAEGLEYGIIGINDGLPSTPQAPFGGFKHSGLGREGGPHGIDEYLEVKYISLAF